MVNPGSFRGARLEFLSSQKPLYAAAMVGNSKNECVADIQRRYFKRFPVELPHDVDPSPETLASVNDNEADAERPVPDPKKMSPEEYTRAKKEHDSYVKLLKFRKEQISRWLAREYSKGRGVSRKEVDVENPMTVLMARLTSTPLSKPRCPIPFNLWSRENKAQLDETYEHEKGPNGRVDLNMRRNIARNMFAKLSRKEKDEWQKKANDLHKEELFEWESMLNREAPTDPESRQSCIENLVSFMQPILDLVCEYTGMKATTIIGGPEPADGGRLNILSIHSGTTPGPVNLNFGQAERMDYRQQVIPTFSKFLTKCYSKADCEAMAYPYNAPSLSTFVKTDDLDRGASLEPHQGVEDERNGPLVSNLDHPNTRSKPANVPSTAKAPQIPLDPRLQEPAFPDPSHASDSGSREPVAPHQTPASDSLSSTSATRPSSEHPAGMPSSESDESPQPNSVITPTTPASQPRATSPMSTSGKDSEPQASASLVSEPAAASASSDSRSLTFNFDIPPSCPPSPASLPPQSPKITPSTVQPPASIANDTENPNPPVDISVGDVRGPTGTPATDAQGGRDTKDEHSAVPQKRRLTDGNEDEGASGNKRRKSSDGSVLLLSPDVPPPIEAPAGAPAWVILGLKMLNSHDFGVEWGQFLQAWLKLESKLKFKDTAKFVSTRRPAAVGAWIQRARKPSYRPSVNLAVYPGEFWAWWAALQPKWRKITASAMSRIVSGDWSCLNHSGVNGWLSIAGCLFFWARALKEGKEPLSASWKNAIIDVTWVLNQIVEGN